MNSHRFFMLIFLFISFSVQAAEGLLLRKQLAVQALPPDMNSLAVSLYDSRDASEPVAQQVFFPGEWQAAASAGGTVLSVDFTELPAGEKADGLWMQMYADDKPLGRRVIIAAASSPGVTFASGNNLDMDGNHITNLADPGASQDAANKAYVDAQVGGVPGGDITAVTAGTGLSGGGNTGAVTLSADTNYLQRRVSSSCTAGSSIRAIDANGTVSCETDDDAGGDITAVTAGTGLHGGGTSGDVTLDMNIPLVLRGSAGVSIDPAGLIQVINDSPYGFGIEGFGNWGGGYFEDSDGSGLARVGYDNFGIQAYGNVVGGYFADTDNSGSAYVGTADYGIEAFGNTVGGYFEDPDNSGYAYVGHGDNGIDAYGNAAGGYVKDADSSGYAYVGVGDFGITAYGNTTAGYFEDANNSGHAYVGFGDNGIQAYGNAAGGYFEDITSNNYARVGHDTYKIQGTGGDSFVQNHPDNPDQVIVYTAPEGDEVATYTRGSARLVNGEARIPLGETFKWVTNPDIGLTAHLTPKGGWAALYVAELTTSELVVKAAPGSADDASFDYIVYGLRIGFEDTTVVQKKTQEARIPSMASHRKAMAEQPELARYTALSRYARMQGSSREAVRQNMSAAAQLLAKIGEFDPKVDKVEAPKMEK